MPSPFPPNAEAGANSLFLPCLWFGGEAFAARADAVGGWLAFIPPPKATRDFEATLGDLVPPLDKSARQGEKWPFQPLEV